MIVLSNNLYIELLFISQMDFICIVFFSSKLNYDSIKHMLFFITIC